MELNDPEKRPAALAVLRHTLIAILKMLHPFMPFITDAVYRYIPGTEGTIMLSAWPEADEKTLFPEAAKAMEGIMEVIKSVRNLRAEMNVAVGKRAHLLIRPKQGWEAALETAGELFTRLAWASNVQILGMEETVPGKTVSCVSEAAEVFIPLGDLVDFEKEIARLEKERNAIAGEIARSEGKLNNPGFTAKAPAKLVEQEKEKLQVNRDKLAKLESRLEDLKQSM